MPCMDIIDVVMVDMIIVGFLGSVNLAFFGCVL